MNGVWPPRQGCDHQEKVVYLISVIPTQLLIGVSKPNKKPIPVLKKQISKALEKTRLQLKFQSLTIYNLKPLLQNQNLCPLSHRTISLSQLQTSIATDLHCRRSCDGKLQTSSSIGLCLIENSLKSSILLIISQPQRQNLSCYFQAPMLQEGFLLFFTIYFLYFSQLICMLFFFPTRNYKGLSFHDDGFGTIISPYKGLFFITKSQNT